VAHRAGMGAPAITMVYWMMTAVGAACGVGAGRPESGTPQICLYAALACMPFLIWMAYVIARTRKADITRW